MQPVPHTSKDITLSSDVAIFEGITRTLQLCDQLKIENSTLKEALVKLQCENKVLQDREILTQTRLSKLEEELVLCKNELRHAKRQLNDKTSQALAAAEREVLLVELLERYEKEKSELQLRLDSDIHSSKRDRDTQIQSQDANEGESEAISKLEDMLESLLSLGEHEQISENERLVQQNLALKEILSNLQIAEMKKLYLEYVVAGQNITHDENRENSETKNCDKVENVFSGKLEDGYGRSPMPTLSNFALSDEKQNVFKFFEHDHQSELQIPGPISDVSMPHYPQTPDLEGPSFWESVVADQNKKSPMTNSTPADSADRHGVYLDEAGIKVNLALSKEYSASRDPEYVEQRPADMGNKRNKWPTPRWNLKRQAATDQSRSNGSH